MSSLVPAGASFLSADAEKHFPTTHSVVPIRNVSKGRTGQCIFLCGSIVPNLEWL